MRIALIVMAVVSVAPALSGGEVYKNQLAAEKALGMATDVKVGWGSHCVRRGGKSFAFLRHGNTIWTGIWLPMAGRRACLRKNA